MTDGGAAASTDAVSSAAAPLHVAIRTDASAAIGTGHLRRCLALAEALLMQGAEVCFVVRRIDAVAEGVLHGSPYPVWWLPAPPPGSQPELEDPEGPPHRAWAGVAWAVDAAQTIEALRTQPPHWLVVDHYALDARWHDALRAALGCRLLVVDDVADRPLAPDLLLDHNWAPDHRAKYAGHLTREPAAWLTGPRFALLSAAYRDAPRYMFHPQVRSIGVFMGGTDPGAASAHVLRCLREEVGFTGPVEVVSTSANPQLPALSKACAASPNTTLTLDLPDLAAFFARHDLQIGAGGGAIWERCCTAAPVIAVVVADNQAASLPYLAALGVLQTATISTIPVSTRAGPAPSLGVAVARLVDDSAARNRLSARAAKLVDGRGAERAALRITAPRTATRPALLSDAELIHRWRNDAEVRAMSLNPGEINLSDHISWMKSILRSESYVMLIGMTGSLEVGCVRLDMANSATMRISIFIDPGLKGLGVGTALLRSAEDHLRNRQPAVTHLEALVKEENGVSQALFAHAGYVRRGTALSKKLMSPPCEGPEVIK